MEKRYQAVNVVENDDVESNLTSWKYFFRQIVLASAIWMHYLTAGLCVGTPTVLVPQWTKEHNVVIDDEKLSWLFCGFGLAALPWVLLAPVMSMWLGRKLPCIISSITMFVVFLVQYFSVEIYHILISEALQGFSHACNITITVFIITEYVDPKYRGLFLTIKSASFFWGIWIANAIGTFFHWRCISVVGLFCSVYSLVGAYYPESPHWLASKGNYNKARVAFRWLRGTNQSSELELQAIIEFQLDYRKQKRKKTKFSWDKFVKTISCRLFYMPLSLSMLMGFQYHFSGKLVCSTYAVDMIERVTGDEAIAYTGMLILDGVTVFGMYIGSFVSKFVKRRTLYIPASSIGVLFLFLLSLHLYLVKLGIIAENTTVAIVLLTTYSLSISCGPMIMSLTVIGEIIPLRYQAICYSAQATVFSIIFTVLLKFAPSIFNSLGMDGSFLFYGITSGASLVGLYFFLPETKDKTLLEIEEMFTDKKCNRTSDLNEEKTVF